MFLFLFKISGFTLLNLLNNVLIFLLYKIKFLLIEYIISWFTLLYNIRAFSWYSIRDRSIKFIKKAFVYIQQPLLSYNLVLLLYTYPFKDINFVDIFIYPSDQYLLDCLLIVLTLSLFSKHNIHMSNSYYLHL